MTSSLIRGAVIAIASMAIACGGGGSSPTSPSTPTTSAGTRVIGLSGIVALGNVTVGTSASATFTITNSGTAALTVSSLTLPAGVSGAYSANFTSGTIPPGGSQQVSLKCSPTAAQDYGGTLTVTGDQTSGTNTMAVSCVGVLGPGVAATRIIGLSGNPSFGNVAVGQTGQAVFTITNSGNSPLTITGMTVSACSSDFSASWTSGTIPPGGAQQVTLFFKPQAAQVCNATITVKGDQTSGTSTIAASASGSGSAPAPAPSPTPSGGTKYDGTYDFSFQYAAPGGAQTQNLSRYLFIRNGVVSSSDGVVNGTVDANFGSITFKAPCPISSGSSTWTGIMDASARSGSNFGQGHYGCNENPFGGGNSLPWTARQSQ
jgi:hypothetical protein